MTGWQKWIPDALTGVAVLVLGLAELQGNIYFGFTGAPVIVVVCVAVAVALFRAAPGVALAIAWVMAAVQLGSNTAPLLVEVFLALVAFGCARWGGWPVVWLSGASIPAGALVAVWWLRTDFVFRLLDLSRTKLLAERAYDSSGGDWRVVAAGAVILLLALPWLAGLALRFSARAHESEVSQVAAEAERDQAAEIARLREDQARLARDVHDVVGHSLAVILAQAESAQYLKDADTSALKQTMANIATSARTSLQDVRQVLTTTGGAAAPARTAGLDSLIDGVEASGHDVRSTEIGVPQPLPPELDGVAFRVLQEMLTNAIKHGQRGEPILVERHWEGELRIEVRNVIDTGADETQPLVLAEPIPEHRGQGLDGMRRRLESVGGRLDVRRRAEQGGPTFTATAWVPVRSR
jgi:signal transduction histidine kinase